MTIDELSLLQTAYRATPGNLDLALLLSRKLAALEMWPEVAEMLLPLANRFDPENATAPPEEAPHNIELALVFARSLLETGRTEPAEEWFERLHSLAPEQEVAALADAFAAKGIHPRQRVREAATGKDGDELEGLTSFRPLDLKTRSQVRFADVGGLDDLKEAARMQIILPFQKPELFAKYGKRAGGGMLLYGPPGCGKTFFAKAVAGECGAAFFAVGIHDILNLYVGNSERNVRKLFESARAHRPAILFIDEIDALGRKRELVRGSNMTGTINAFLNELDGLGNDNDGLLTLGATNAPWDIDSAFKRPGRFDRRLFLPPPDTVAREEILKLHFAGKPQQELDFATLAKKSEYFSGADLAALADCAADRVLTEILRSGQERPIAMADVLAALKDLKPSTLEWLAVARNYVEYANEEGAYEEIGAYLD